MKNRKFPVILIGLLLLTFSVQSQVVSFVKYGVENGLIQSQVQAFQQDNKGRLWVGTISGVSVYNGVEFKNYTTKDSLAENWVSTMYKTKNGDIWMGHWAGSLSRYDAENDIFENVDIEGFNEFQTISDFVEDTLNNRLFFSSVGSGLFIYHFEDDRVSKVEIDESTESKYITTLFQAPNGKIWVGTENSGIYVFNPEAIADNKVATVNITLDDGLPSNRIVDIEVFNDEIWIGTSDKGIARANWSQASNIKAGQPIELSFDLNSEEDILPSDQISDILVDHDNGLWIGTRNKGVLRIMLKGGRYHFQSYNTKEGLSFYDVNCLFVDRENSIWIGTNVGVNQYVSDGFLLYNKSVGIANNIIWSIQPDGKGNIWLGTNSGVSKLMNGADRENDDLKVQKIGLSGLSDVGVRSIYKDKEGNTWFATSEGRLFKRDKSGKFQKINIQSVLQDIIFCMQDDDQGYLWLGTRAGAARLNKQTLSLDFFSEKEGLGGNNVLKITKDTKGNLWFACSGGYLTKYDGENFTKYTEEDGVKPFILCVTADKLGNIYFGGYTSGLYKYDGTEFTNYTSAESGLRAETPYALIADDENNIWIGTSYGVEKFDPRTEKFFHYGKTEGFLGLEVNYNSIARDENDNIWFGTILGAVKYNPAADDLNDVQPTVSLSGLEVNQEPAEFPFDNEFDPTNNDLAFNYIGVSLNKPNKVRYQYMLEGFEKEWSTETKTRKAFYSNLDPGKYVFKVKALNSDDIASVPVEYSFRVETPFYMSYYFYGGQVVFIILLMTLAVFYGRKTGGSRIATVLATIALIIVFEYGINFVEDSLEDSLGGVVFIKVGLNVLLALLLFPVEELVKKLIVRGNEDNKKGATT